MNAISTALSTLWAPTRALTTVSQKRWFAWPLLIITVVTLLFAAVAAPRIDFRRTAADAIDRTEQGAKMTPHEREEALETARKVGSIGVFASSLFSPTVTALAAAVFLWLAFRVAGAKPQFVATFAVAAHAFLPLAVKHIVSLPSLATRSGMLAYELQRLLPSNLAAFLPADAPIGPRLAFFSAMDLFNVWALVLVVIGMAIVAKVSVARAAITSTVLWAAYIAIFVVAIPAMTMGAQPS